MDGILLVDKPKGWTSFDVVAKVRGQLRNELIAHSSQLIAASPKVKVGHTGTLDPLATGLLVLLIGDYTKKAGEFSKLDKTYEASLKLGFTSTTGDGEGKISKSQFKQRSFNKTRVGEVENILNTFVGEIEQTPPTYSAIKVNGQRAYKLARAGKAVKIEPRKVKIYSITDIKYSYPDLKFTTKVSSGTYIRTLAEDIGKKLDTGAYLTNLRRTKVGLYNVQNSIKVEKLEKLYNNLQN